MKWFHPREPWKRPTKNGRRRVRAPYLTRMFHCAILYGNISDGLNWHHPQRLTYSNRYNFLSGKTLGKFTERVIPLESVDCALYWSNLLIYWLYRGVLRRPTLPREGPIFVSQNYTNSHMTCIHGSNHSRPWLTTCLSVIAYKKMVSRREKKHCLAHFVYVIIWNRFVFGDDLTKKWSLCRYEEMDS